MNTPTKQVHDLLEIAWAAHRLEDWLGKHVGTNDDWPVEIRTDDAEVSEELCKMINNLTLALVPFRVIHAPEALPKPSADGAGGSG